METMWQMGFPPTASLHNCLSWRPGSTWLALQCDAAMLVVLDVSRHNDEMPSEVQRLAWSKGGDLMAVAWTEDGRFLVTAHAGALGALSVFQVECDSRLAQVLHCPIFFWPKDVCVSSSHDDTSQLSIAVCGSPGVVLYKACIDEGSGRWGLQQAGRLCHLWPVCAVKYSPDGSYLAAAGLGGQLCIWDMTAADAKLELQVQVPAERVTSMAFSPCGHALAVACWGGAVFLYLQQDAALDPPELSANSLAASELGVKFNAEAAQACKLKAGPEQGGGHMLPAAVPVNEVIGEGDEAAYQLQPVGSAHGADVEAAVQHTSTGSPSDAAQGGGRAGGVAALILGKDFVAQGAAAPCESRLAAINLGEQDTRSVNPPARSQGRERAGGLAALPHGDHTVAQGSPAAAQGGEQAGGLAAVAHGEDTAAQGPPAAVYESRLAAINLGEQDTASVSPSAAAQGGGRPGGLACAAHGEDTAAQGPPAAVYESRLAAIDHGMEGAGGWRVGGACLPGQPIKADLTGPTLLEWVGDDALLVTLPSGALSVLRLDGATLVQEEALMASLKKTSKGPQVTGNAMASQNDGTRRDTESYGQDVPSGLRVLSVGRAEGWSHAGMAKVVEGDANCVKGLAVMHLSGQRLVVCYDRTRSLRMLPVADP